MKRQIFKGTRKELFDIAKEQGMFELENKSEDFIRKKIKECEGKHIQQVVFSTYHNALTQICFGCKMIRTSIKEEDLKNEK